MMSVLKLPVTWKWLLVLGCAWSVGLAFLPAGASACDDPVYAIARQKWPLEMYLLLYAHQPGVGDAKAFEQATRQDWLVQSVNIEPLAWDMSRPVRFYQERRMLQELGVSGYPFVVLLDGGGGVLERFGTLEEARRRLAPPATQPEVVSYGMHRIELKSPAARIVIVCDSKASVAEAQEAGPAEPESAEPAPAKLIASVEQARQWSADIGREPLAGLAKADVVDIRNPGGDRAVIEALKLRLLPVCLLVNPDGEPVETFDRMPTEAELRKIAFSPTRDEIVRLLAVPQNAMVMLMVLGDDRQANIEAMSAVNQAARQAASMFKVKVPVLQMDPADDREAYLVRILGRKTGQSQPLVVPVIGQGKVMQVMAGPVKADEVLDHIQLAFHPCGCSVMPRDIGWDLLLGSSGQTWTPFDSPMLAAVRQADADTPAVDEATRQMALASFGVDPKLWLMLGLAVVAGVGLIGGLFLFLKARVATRTG